MMNKISFCYKDEEENFLCGDRREECSWYSFSGAGNRCANSSLSSNGKTYCNNEHAQFYGGEDSDTREACDRVYAMVSGGIHDVVEYGGEEYVVAGWYDNYDAHITDCVVLRKANQAVVKMVHWRKLWSCL